MTSVSLLVSSPELNLEKEICNTSYLLTLKLRQNFIICAQFREEIPGMDTCYIKRNPLQLNKAEAYYPHVYASKYKKIGIFCAITSVNRVQSTEVKQFYSNLPP